MTGAALNPQALRNAAASATVALWRTDFGSGVMSSAAARARSASGGANRFGVRGVTALVLRRSWFPAEGGRNGRAGYAPP